jgi:hypothetical protein
MVDLIVGVVLFILMYPIAIKFTHGRCARFEYCTKFCMLILMNIIVIIVYYVLNKQAIEKIYSLIIEFTCILLTLTILYLNLMNTELIPKLIDYALKRMVLEQALRKIGLKPAFSIKSKVAVPKLKFWNSFYYKTIS